MNQKIEFNVCCTEVYAFLRYLGYDYISKIPEQVMSVIRKSTLNEYDFKYSPQLLFNDQVKTQMSVEMIDYLNLHFWADQKEREYLTKLYTVNEEKMKREREDEFENLLKNHHKVSSSSNEITELTEPTKKQTTFNKIISFIKKIFKIGK